MNQQHRDTLHALAVACDLAWANGLKAAAFAARQAVWHGATVDHRLPDGLRVDLPAPGECVPWVASLISALDLRA